MPTISNITVGDNYTPAATLENIWNAPTGGWFSILNQAAIFQLQYGRRGSSQWGLEQELGSGAYGSIPENCTGIRFRNATPGLTAIISATIVQADEPAIAISALGELLIPASATPTQQIFQVGGAGIYDTPAGCKAIMVECWGAGGGGGGTQLTAFNQLAAAGGGGGGGYSSSLIVTPSSSYAYSIGVGGGSAASSPGTAGENTSFAGGLIIANGGSGGGLGNSEPNSFISNGGAGGSIAGAQGNIQLPGSPGGLGIVIIYSGTLMANWSGNGGDSARGSAGAQGEANTTAQGKTGQNFGAGGSGGIGENNQSGQSGGNGADGAIVVTEYY